MKKGRKIALVLFLAVCWAARIPSYGGMDGKFRSLTVADGLSQGVVHCILQDHLGFIWCGTIDGLNRYDGTGFSTYRPIPGEKNSLTHGEVRAICEDPRGRLWVGTAGGGLNLLDRRDDRFRNFRTSPGDPSSLSHDFIETLLVDRGGTLWIGTRKGLNRMDDTRDGFTRFLQQKNRTGDEFITVTSIYEDREGFLWVGCGNAVYRSGPGKNSFTPHGFDNLRNQEVNPGRVTGIVEDYQNTLWVAAYEGIFYLHRDSGKFRAFPLASSAVRDRERFLITALYAGRDKKLWIGTPYHGIILLDPVNRREKIIKSRPGRPGSLINDNINTIYRDRSGLVWIGTGGGGISIYDERKYTLSHHCHIPGVPGGPNNNSIWAVYEDRSGTLWIGTGGGGLNRFDRAGVTAKYYLSRRDNPRTLSNNFVYSIMEDSRGSMWIGTIHGLNRFDPGSEIFTRFYKTGDSSGLSHNRVVKVIENPSGYLWIATGGGLDRLDIDGRTFRHYRHEPAGASGLSHDKIADIFLDRSGTLWVGTEGGGINCLPYNQEHFTRFRYAPGQKDCLSHNTVISILEARDGTLWFGTRGGGINRLERGETSFTSYTTREGLPSNIIYGILEDDHGNLWLSTNKGLSRFNPHTGSTRNFTEDDGIQGYEFNCRACYKSTGGEFFFGGLNGFNSFYPDQIKDNLYVPPIVITGIDVLRSSGDNQATAIWEKRTPNSRQFRLSHDENIFSLHFAALDYAQPEKNQYKYKLEGFADDWIFLGNKTETTFTNLDPGKYTFRVLGSNNNGVWNNEGASMEIVITPPFLETWWARVLLLLTVSAILLYLHRRRLKNQVLRLKTEEEFNRAADRYRISTREKEILKLVLKGKTNKEIEEELFIADKTVKTHIYNIYRKTGVKNRLELINKLHLFSKTTP